MKALFPHQEEGAQWLAPRARAGLLDEPGVGKTATLIRAFDLRQARRIIVVVPAVGRANWLKEFRTFSTIPRRLVKGVTIHDYVAWSRDVYDVLVTSYEQMTKWCQHFDGEIIDGLAFDEAHYLKNLKSLRTRTLLGTLPVWSKTSYWATGTPVPNDPMDIYTFLRFAKCMPLPPSQFKARYMTVRYGAYAARHKLKLEQIPELRSLIGNNAIRRTLAATGVSLPPLTASPYLIEGDTEHVRKLLLEHPGLDTKIKTALEEGRGLSSLDDEHIATLRRLLGEAKALPYAELLLHEFASGLDKMVVFGIHRQALLTVRDKLLAGHIHTLLINGDTPERQREAYVEAFQSDPNVRCIILNIRTGGTVLTLTASARVDMLESEWNDDGNFQAIKRVHRFTQMRGVRARFMTLADSFDEVVNEIVAEKAANTALIHG